MKTIEEHWDSIKWKKLKNRTQTFQFGDEPELIHIIKTGFKDKYMIVYEDAYEFDLGLIKFGTKTEIEKKYKIKL